MALALGGGGMAVVVAVAEDLGNGEDGVWWPSSACWSDPPMEGRRSGKGGWRANQTNLRGASRWGPGCGKLGVRAAAADH